MDYVDIRRGPIYMVTGSRSQTGKTGKKENREDIALYTLSTMSCCPVSSLPRLIPFFFPPFFWERNRPIANQYFGRRIGINSLVLLKID
jgi:hypothetical protein